MGTLIQKYLKRKKYFFLWKTIKRNTFLFTYFAVFGVCTVFRCAVLKRTDLFPSSCKHFLQFEGKDPKNLKK